MPAKRGRGRPRKRPASPVSTNVNDDQPKLQRARTVPQRFADGATDDEAMAVDTETGPVEAAAVGLADDAETAPRKRRPAPRSRVEVGTAFIPEAPAPATESGERSGEEEMGEEEMGEEETAKIVKSILGTESVLLLFLLTFFADFLRTRVFEERKERQSAARK